jgi:hypothetical protein
MHMASHHDAAARKHGPGHPAIKRLPSWAYLLLAMCGLLVMNIPPTHAQAAFPDAEPIRFGEPVTGRLDGVTLRQTYRFEGRRGEFLSLSVIPEGGNLDPLLTVVDDSGAVLASVDDGQGRGAVLDTLRIPRNGQYYIVVARFAGVFGITAGAYTLLVERVGISSESGSSLRYNDTIINAITDNTPQHYYSFQARRGDILDIQMQRISGQLDPYLQIVNSDAIVIAESDDVPGSNTLDAGIEQLVIDQDGTYVIVATRYGVNTGSFVLSLAESTNSGLGNTIQTAAELPDDTFVTGEITRQQPAQFYTFTARADDLIRIQMNRVNGSLDAYLILLDEDLREIAVDDDGGGGQNAQINGVQLPRDGLYYIQATRFEGREGDTVGQYRLRLERLGGAFEDAPAEAQPIRYGSTITGVIGEEAPAVLYAFYGTQGDVITVAMNRGDGNLDPFVAILGEDLQPLASDDDSGGGQNARIERFVLGRTGVYYIRATRYTGPESTANTRGSYILVLAQRFD